MALAARSTVIILFFNVFGGCIAGGIGQYHNPSEKALVGGGYKISMELSAPGGNAKKGFTAAQIVLPNQSPRNMNRSAATKETAVFVAEIPVAELPVGAFSYHFVYQAGGKEHVFRPAHNLPVTVRDRLNGG